MTARCPHCNADQAAAPSCPLHECPIKPCTMPKPAAAEPSHPNVCPSCNADWHDYACNASAEAGARKWGIDTDEGKAYPIEFAHADCVHVVELSHLTAFEKRENILIDNLAAQTTMTNDARERAEKAEARADVAEKNRQNISDECVVLRTKFEAAEAEREHWRQKYGRYVDKWNDENARAVKAEARIAELEQHLQNVDEGFKFARDDREKLLAAEARIVELESESKNE